MQISFRNDADDYLVHWFDEFGLLRSDYGQLGNLCILFDHVMWFLCVCYSDWYFFVQNCWHSVWKLQTGCFRDFFYWCHSTCCVPFWWVVNKRFDRLRCLWCYCWGYVKSNSLRFSSFFSLAALFTWFVKCERWTRPCLVSKNTLLFVMKCKLMIGPVNFFITTKFSTNKWYRITCMSVIVVNGFSTWPFATWIWILGGLLIFKILAGVCRMILVIAIQAIVLT